MRSSMLLASLLLALTTAFTPLLAVSAQAATVRTWERLAQCESGQRWHLNSGNGYYGGLQFSGRTWRAFNGTRFARYAHRATKSEQIKVAERVRRAQGWGAWPTCSSRIGLR